MFDNPYLPKRPQYGPQYAPPTGPSTGVNPRIAAAQSLAGGGASMAGDHAAPSISSTAIGTGPTFPSAGGGAGGGAGGPDAGPKYPGYFGPGGEGDQYFGKGPGAKGIQKGILRQTAGNAFRANPLMWAALQQLQASADPEKIAENYAGEYERNNQYYDRAEGALTRNLTARGIDDSSAMTSGLGALASGRASGEAGINREINQDVEGRQDAYRNAIMGLATGSANSAASQADQLRQLKIALAQLKMQQDQAGGFDIGGLLGGIGSLAGSGMFGGF